MSPQKGQVDVLVVGGGINGVGIARDAAGRGLSVFLTEQSDLASGTSSASSKLIHGGLRYLEHYEFRLVRESLAEREVLWAAAPHIIHPLRFVLPVHGGPRPPWLIRAGLLLYDHLGGRRRLPGTRRVRQGDAAMAPLTATLRTGFEYSDCWVDDARLVVINAIDAHERGAHVAVRSALTAARREADNWVVTITNRAGEQRVLRARALVNAAGPWVENVLKVVGVPRGGGLRLVKGSHIIVPRLYEGPHAYTLQSADGRVVFIIPYQDYFTLIGTTDVPFTGDPAVANASAEEVAYLCDVASRYLTIPVRPSDVVWTYAGVRPLYDDGSQNASHVTRDYVLDIAAPAGQAPLISIFGGKITTYRTLAEHVLQALAPSLGITVGRWTRAGILPGGDLRSGNFEAFVAQKVAQYASLDRSMVRRLCRAYGTRLDQILGSDLGAEVVPGLFEAELRYMRDCEWAQSAEDALWRRSKLGLTLDAAEREKVTAWFGS